MDKVTFMKGMVFGDYFSEEALEDWVSVLLDNSKITGRVLWVIAIFTIGLGIYQQTELTPLWQWIILIEGLVFSGAAMYISWEHDQLLKALSEYIALKHLFMIAQTRFKTKEELFKAMLAEYQRRISLR